MIFGHNYLISDPIFKLFVALFRTHELQKDDMVIFFLWCFRKVGFRKMQFLKDGVQTVDYAKMMHRYTYEDRVHTFCRFLSGTNLLRPKPSMAEHRS